MAIISIFEVRLREDSLAEAPELVGATIDGTRAQPGCLDVEVAVDVDDPTRYILIEKWASLADDDAYRAWRGTPEGIPAVGAIVAGPPVLTRAEQQTDL